MVGKSIIVIISAYLLGAVPIGWLIVKVFKGKDVREVGSGRVGSTNVMRAAGFFAGFVTAVFDAGKGLLAGWISESILPGVPWVKVIAVSLSVIGQIYSIFLIEKTTDGKLFLRGGAGGSTTFGGFLALSPSLWYLFIPLVGLVYFFIGYASITTISIAFFSLIFLSYEFIIGTVPWQYILFGVVALIVVIITLRPNLIRLKQGNERVVGLRALLQKKSQSSQQ